VSVAAAIVDGDRVLAIRRRDNGKWEPPGGTLEPAEAIVDGLRREVAEETGLAISDPSMSGIYKNMSRGIVALVFRCLHDGSEPIPTAEAVEVRWLTRGEIEALLDPAYAVRLLDAFQPGVAIRAHDGTNLMET
jgi:8-oxo-dGTP diphosphatase